MKTISYSCDWDDGIEGGVARLDKKLRRQELKGHDWKAGMRRNKEVRCPCLSRVGDRGWLQGSRGSPLKGEEV